MTTVETLDRWYQCPVTPATPALISAWLAGRMAATVQVNSSVTPASG
jgi:hypothetical protein